MPAKVAADDVLPCCGSHAWASALAAQRPLSTLQELLAASDAAWWSLPEEDWREAFDSHPRIGERHAQGVVTEKSLGWSGSEQSGAITGNDIAAKLADGNRAYEEKFGRTFIIRATGKSAADILLILEHRMGNTAEAELQEAAEQQREITHIRLQKWLAEHEETQA